MCRLLFLVLVLTLAIGATGCTFTATFDLDVHPQVATVDAG